MHKKLFIPGPVDVREDVLQKLATPQIGHRTKEATELQKRITEKLQKVFYTNNTIVLSTSSGTGLMEAAVRCCTKSRVAVFSCGAFGNKWYTICKDNGIPADKITVEAGVGTSPELVDEVLTKGNGIYDVVTVQHNETSSGIMNPIGKIGALLKEKYPDVLFMVDAVSSLGGAKIENDAWGVDICITSTQKAMGLPAGMSFASVSERAIEKARTVENRGHYFDLVLLYDFVKKNYQYPSTPSLPHMFALDYQLDKIMAEGLDNRFKRHEEMANVVRNWARKNFGLLVTDESYLSNTVTCIRNTKGIDVADLNKKLGERGFMISNGYKELKDITFRISHMADYTVEEVEELLRNIDEVLGL